MDRDYLKSFAARCNSLTLKELMSQFGGWPSAPTNGCSGSHENPRKNRYIDVMCLDKTRVQLTFLLEEGTYIHANHIQYPSLKNQLIIAQGPLKTTIADFWRLVWQEKTESIAMLCSRGECAEYFPQQASKSLNYGQITVTTKKRETQELGTILSHLEMTWNGEKRSLLHYHMLNWEDCRAPVANQLFKLLEDIRLSRTVVHCSAGIGRSGTLVALEMCLNDLLSCQSIDILKIVKELREYRCQAVETFEQFLGIHKFVLQFGETKGILTQEEVQPFYQLFEAYSMSQD